MSEEQAVTAANISGYAVNLKTNGAATGNDDMAKLALLRLAAEIDFGEICPAVADA